MIFLGLGKNVLLNEQIWSHAFGRQKIRAKKTQCNVFMGYLQFVYEKSRLHNILPVVVLIAYSLLGGLIFYSLESPHERTLIQEKANFINNEKRHILHIVYDVQRQIGVYQESYRNNSRVLHLRYRDYRRYALNELHKRVYWYALSAYYLTEQETHKAQALRPRNTEERFRPLVMQNNLGRIYALQNYTEQLALRCWEIGIENGDALNTSEQVKNATDRFDTLTGLNHVLTPVWTFWNAMLLAVTTYTTIGYGNVTAKTWAGQMAAMVYAVIGIPLVLMILHKLGRLSLSALATVWRRCERIADSISSSASVSETDEQGHHMGPQPAEIPLLLAIGVAFGWMFLCAGIYLVFEEDWDYFKSFYFFFCSLTTIGYGDVTPTHSEDMFLIFGLVIVGLSLVSMCINVIQLKLEKVFEELLLSLMEEYSADPDARAIGEQIGLLEMWRVWKKRKNRLRQQAAARRAAGAAAGAARDTAVRAGEQLAKVIPFVRRRERHRLIRQMRERLKQLDKSTQTDFVPRMSIGCDPLLFGLAMNPGNYSLLVPHTHFAHPEMMSSYTPSPRPSPISSPLPSASSSSISSPVWPPECSSSSGSVMSAPTNPSGFPLDFDPSRRWTFVEAGKAPRGAPRGLVGPSMQRERQDSMHTNEMRRLIAEIDSRLRDTRTLVTPSPYTSSGESFV